MLLYFPHHNCQWSGYICIEQKSGSSTPVLTPGRTHSRLATTYIYGPIFKFQYYGCKVVGLLLQLSLGSWLLTYQLKSSVLVIGIYKTVTRFGFFLE